MGVSMNFDNDDMFIKNEDPILRELRIILEEPDHDESYYFCIEHVRRAYNVSLSQDFLNEMHKPTELSPINNPFFDVLYEMEFIDRERIDACNFIYTQCIGEELMKIGEIDEETQKEMTFRMMERVVPLAQKLQASFMINYSKSDLYSISLKELVSAFEIYVRKLIERKGGNKHFKLVNAERDLRNLYSIEKPFINRKGREIFHRMRIQRNAITHTGGVYSITNIEDMKNRDIIINASPGGDVRLSIRTIRLYFRTMIRILKNIEQYT